MNMFPACPGDEGVTSGLKLSQPPLAGNGLKPLQSRLRALTLASTPIGFRLGGLHATLNPHSESKSHQIDR